MIVQNGLQHNPARKSLSGCALQGAGIVFVLVIVFLVLIFSFGGGLNGMNLWQGLWQFFPLVTATTGGALGGMVYYVVGRAWNPIGRRKGITIVFSMLIYLLLVWISLVAGFSATGQWD